MISRMMAFALIIFLCACQSKSAESDSIQHDSTENDPLAVDVEGDESEGDVDIANALEEKVVSFQEFHSVYIATGKIRTLELPLVFQEAEPLLSTLDSPEGAFENTPKKNHEVRIYGLLPDTTRYYAIVYGFQMFDYIDTRPTDIYSMRVATFTKQGKFIGRAKIIDVGNFTGASSCVQTENEMFGYIDTNLSFFGIHFLTQDCSMEGSRIRPMQLSTSSMGMIKKDGTIECKTKEIADSGDEDENEVAEILRVEDTPFTATMERIANQSMLTAGDLMAFFPMEELSTSDPYTWYTLYFPTGNIKLMSVVRRIKTKDETIRKRHYGFAVLTNETVGRHYNFYWDDSKAIESNEPSVSMVDEHFVLITTTDAAGPTGKYAEENNTVLILSGIDLLPATDLSKEDLRIERNMIFAKRGMKFKSVDLTAYFSKFDWYKPTRDNIPDSELNYATRQVVNVLQGLERQ